MKEVIIMSKIGGDINYRNMGKVFDCKVCGHPLLMFGCCNDSCENSQKNNLAKGARKTKKKVRKVK